MWTGWAAVVAVSGLAVVVLAATGWMLAWGTRGAEIANVWALPVAVSGLAATLFGWTLRPSAADQRVLAAAARALARDVAEQEAAAQQRLLADTGDARPANVRFAQPAPSPLLWRDDGGDQQGTLETVAEFYRGLKRGRLVVLGEPGAGKTVLAIQVLLDLIRTALSQPDPDSGTTAGLRVPVRLSLPAFPFASTDVLAPDVISRRLDDWIAAHLVTAYGQRPTVARQLVAQGWILPILDGLDEMDPEGAAPVRASAMADGLNHPTGPALRPVVVTCRTHFYRQLAEDPAALEIPRMVQDATTVVMQPLTAGQVVRWLAHRFGDPSQPHGVQRRWQPVITRLIQRPNGALATCLSSPLRLYLAVTAYRNPVGTPRELLTIPATDLDQHLLTRLIPAVTASYPRSDGSRYRPGDVTRWLATLAHHLTWMGQHGGSDSDLYLYDLWRGTGHPDHRGRSVRYLAAAVYTALTAALLTISSIPAFIPADPLTNPWTTWTILAIDVTFVGYTAILATSRRCDSRRLDLSQLRTTAGRRRLVTGLAVGLCFGSALGLTVGLTLGLAFGIKFGLAVGLPVGLAVGLSSRPLVIDRPSRLITRDLAYDLTTILTTTVAIGLVLEIGSVFAIAGGLAGGLIARAGSQWPRYATAVHLMARAGTLPARPARFLDWAHTTGLLRVAGTAIQLRHRELQTWLTTAHPRADTAQAITATTPGSA